ncbi:MAG: DNA gyrase inhibitor YacG [Hydrogenophilales bacterium 28-61-23]|nr:MAG: DNA gyrase inhibitor YacG [Hydrogenophilales bacterium 28-61-23]
MAEKFTKVACPTCGKEVEWRPENAFRPFCGERCKLIDLGAWANENYKVPAEQGTFEDDVERP